MTINNYTVYNYGYRNKQRRLSLNPNIDLIEAMLINEKLKVKKTQDLQLLTTNKIKAWNLISESILKLDDTIKNLDTTLDKNMTINHSAFIDITDYSGAQIGDYEIDVLSIGENYTSDGLISSSVDDIHRELGVSGKISDISREYEIIIDEKDSLYTIVQKLNTLPIKGELDTSYKDIDPYKGKIAYLDGNKLVVNKTETILNLNKLKNILGGAGISTSDGVNQQRHVVRVNGKEYASDNGDFNINGLKFTTKKVGSGTYVSIEAGLSIENTVDVVKNLIDSINNLSDLLKEHSSFNGDFSKRGVLNGDTTIMLIRNKLSNLNNIRLDDSNSFKYLFEIGISVDKYGKFTLNEGKLKEVVSTSPSKVENLLIKNYGKTNVNFNEIGLFGRVKILVDNISSNTSSLIEQKTIGLDNKLKELDKTLIKDERRLEKKRDILERQFRATQLAMSACDAQLRYLELIKFESFIQN